MVDLHALRTTLGTNLARQGVPPQIAQKLMRHSDYRTTQKHYTVLGLNDTSGAIEKIPWIRSAVASSATGTDGIAKLDRQQYRQQCARQNVQHAARPCKNQEEDRHGDLSRKSSSHKAFCKAMPRDTMPCNDPAGVTQ